MYNIYIYIYIYNKYIYILSACVSWNTYDHLFRTSCISLNSAGRD